MKKTIKFLATAFLLLFAVGAGAQTQVTPTFTGGSSNATVNTYWDGKTFSSWQYFGGGGSATGNNAKIIVTGACTITLYATGGNNATTARDFVITDGAGYTETKSNAKGTTPATYSYTGTGGTLTIYGKSGANSIYGVFVTYPARSNNANLSALSTAKLNGATLVPAFSPDITNYTATVPYNYQGGCLIGVSEDAKATIDDKNACQSFQADKAAFSITVTAEDGVTKKTYTVIVDREALPADYAALSMLMCLDATLTPAFSPDITEYTATVPYTMDRACLDANPAGDATIDWSNNCNKQNNGALSVGENIRSLTVTAADGVTKKTYTVVITREALQERTETIHLDSVNTLLSLLTNPIEITQLTVTGTMDRRDFVILNRFINLKSLDLSDANIVAYEGYSGRMLGNEPEIKYYPANELPENSFSGLQNLASIIFPKTLTSIGDNILITRNAITSIVIPEGVTRIGDNFATGCVALTTVSLPSTLDSIAGTGCFMACSNLSTVICRNPEAPYANPKGSFYDVRDAVLFVPFGSKTAYENADVWKEFTNIVELPALTEITETPATDGATIEWQAYEHAEGYLLTIYSDELHTDTLHIFEFNAAGEFVGEISLREAGTSHSHTVSGLASGTQYYYTLETLGSGVALEKQTGSFATLGGTTDTADATADALLSVYPNPTRGVVNVSRETTVKVFSLQGVLLQQTVGSQVDLSAYPQGVYLLQVGGQMMKVMKE